MCSSEAWAKPRNLAQEVPFKLYEDHLIVAEGALGGLDQRHLIIDTGTSPTIVDRGIARQLGLENAAQRTGKINVVDGVVSSYSSVLPSVRLGPIHRESIPIVVTDLSWLHDVTGIQVDAIVGLDVLAELDFQIDYASKKIRFGEIQVPRTAVPLTEEDRLLTVQAQLNGKTVKLMVDTGGTGLVLFPGETPQSADSPASASKFSNLAGHSVLQKIQVKELHIGDTNLNGSVALLASAPTRSGYQGILGISEVRFKRVVFDFTHRRVGFELQDPGSPRRFDVDRCEALSGSPMCGEWSGIPRVPPIR
jgi:predicted aspartyl protease